MTPYTVSVALAPLILLRINISVSLSVKLSAQSLIEPGSAKNDHISNQPTKPTQISFDCRWRTKPGPKHYCIYLNLHLTGGESLLSYVSQLAKSKAVSSHGEIILGSQILLNTSVRRQFAYYFSGCFTAR